ncbi:nitrogenase iron-molybdenum cofactor biosynthesis protein NifE [Saccharicrinis fermentans]|uniref:Nitrogenase iron-molybdenum cofactor biosynthesis protein NifE n=1 Tax=Saccharicrinis fermentans DSM 9555 = JCM 21142 TaxID=869213 RepID=A0A0A8XCN6_9BACT|nr:nitrogenase iron-molybdenum cofactor biosynthesis protein NifE [Saccharicrinis fermentans]GAM16782.1 nitrogenase FeMo-cofactor scaffold and assembly protein NifE [Saccharicrinis fermentans DSM 9555 = JCM 21142]
MSKYIKDRTPQIVTIGEDQHDLACEKKSAAGSVSQRACVFCGSRVVLYPIADALHLVHGPIGCAAYTWDIRGAMSSGPQLHRLSFSTDLREKDVVFGGEKKLYSALTELIESYKPEAVFIYSTCIVGVIGDDVEAVARRLSNETGVDVLPVMSEGFKGTKKDGYKAACDALMKLVGTDDNYLPPKYSINILGDFNLAGELWILAEYYKRIGVEIIACLTGDGRVEQVRKCHKASLNVVQCSGSMMHVAKEMEKKYDIPFKKVSYFGIEDMSDALYEVAQHFNDPELMANARTLVSEEIAKLIPALQPYRQKLEGKKAAIYVGGAFKAISLVKALRLLGMQTVVVGSQTGNKDDYNLLQKICDKGTVIVDDSNPNELSDFVKQTGADLFIGGVKERPIAYKLGLGFCDHNHERKEALAGFVGMLNFAKEVYASVCSPVWKFIQK